MRALSAGVFRGEPRAVLIFPVVSLANWVSLPGCSEARFESEQRGKGASAGSAISAGGTAGKSSVGGSSGDPGDGGDGGSGAGRAGASAGRAGATAGCACAPGEYCRASSCYPCSDLSKLDFDAPDLIADDDTTGLRFPRSGPSAGSLFFSRTDASGSALWYLPELERPAPVALAADGVSRAGLVFFGDSAMFGFDSLFDEVRADGYRAVRTASFSAQALTNIAEAPLPFVAGAFDEHSAALATASGRAYWMSTRDGAPALRTGVIGNGESVDVPLLIPATGASGVTCARQGDDATPWVTPDGRLLLFRAAPLDGACAPVDGEASDLYAALLDTSTGLPRANLVVALNGVNTTGDASSETDPSLSPDLCTLYFASDGGAQQGHDFRLYRATRR